MGNRPRAEGIAVGAFLLGLGFGCLLACKPSDSQPSGSAPVDRAEQPEAAEHGVEGGGGARPADVEAFRPRFVGSAACGPCHAEAFARWERSQHRIAMQQASAETVAAPFKGESLTTSSGAVVFVRKGGRLVALPPRTEGVEDEPDTATDESLLRVTGTLGVAPLQQYLFEAVRGRIQILPWAWDTRSRQEGGQRWLPLYPGTAGHPDDPLHFTRPAQNWNHVCADCHVTGYRKRYEAETDRYASRWEELGVGCEACHGPGGEHVRWAGEPTERSEGAETGRDGGAGRRSNGRVARLDERHGVAWRIDPTTGNAVRSVPRTSGREIEVCAPCHARRSAIGEDYQAGDAFLDHYRPALLDPGLYWPDGQQRDEVYAWGSFLQSRMHARGVTCSDCHDPHSGQTRARGNALCANCHAAAKYDAPSHHHHPPRSTGSACVACHMPTTTYMQIDPRHDHSLRVPRPDQSQALSLPSACDGCHGARRRDWAARAVERWLGRAARGFESHAAAIQAAESEALDAGARLRAIARDEAQPAIVRATALSRLDASRSAASATALVAGAGDPDPLIRLGALQGLETAPAEIRIAAAVARLSDERRANRFEAVRLLSPLAGRLDPAAKTRFDREAEAYLASLHRDADRPEARTSLGLFLAERGDLEGARRAFAAAIRIEPAFEAAYVDWADLERAAGRERDATRILESGLARLPESAALHHARGLARVRRGDAAAALADLERAAILAPRSARFGYVFAVAQHDQGEVGAAIARLEALVREHPSDAGVREALVAFLEEAGRPAAARPHREILARAAESDR